MLPQLKYIRKQKITYSPDCLTGTPLTDTLFWSQSMCFSLVDKSVFEFIFMKASNGTIKNKNSSKLSLFIRLQILYQIIIVSRCLKRYNLQIFSILTFKKSVPKGFVLLSIPTTMQNIKKFRLKDFEEIA